MLYTFALVLSSAFYTIAYDNYKVFRLYPDQKSQIKLLRQMEGEFGSISFWKRPKALLREVDVMIAHRNIDDFLKVITENNIRHQIYINDVEGLIAWSHRIRDPNTHLDWKSYHNLDAIYNWMHSIAQRHSGMIEEIEVGHSFERRPIKGLKLSYSNEARPGIFIEGGIHPQEWISPATVTFILNHLLTTNDEFIRRVAERYEWYFFPIFNPDGYAFTHENPTNILNRLWRKTRSVNHFGTQNDTAIGADLNHNWNQRWTKGGTYGYPVSDSYAGSAPFSEIESSFLSNYISSISRKLCAYISLRGYGQTIIFPSEYTYDSLFNYTQQLALASKAKNVLKQKNGIEYRHGSSHNMADSVSGTSVQWVKANFRLPLVFSYEMRDTGHGYMLPPAQIIPNGEEVSRSLIALIKKGQQFGDFRQMIS